MPTTTDLARVLPHNLEAERALLGSILLDNGAIAVAMETISKEVFFSESHRIIFGAMEVIAERGQAIDLVTLSEKLGGDGVLERVGGAAYLAQLTDGVPVGSTASIKEYAGIAKDKSDLRRLINACNNIISRCVEAIDDPRDTAELMIAQAVEIQTGCERSDLHTYRDAGIALVNRLAEKDLPKIITGIPLVDKCTGGFLPGELVIYSAKTGVGKTLFASQTRRHACLSGMHSLFASGEMPAEQLAAREIATKSGVPHWKMRHPDRLEREDFQRFGEVLGRECTQCRILDGVLTMGRIAATARRLKSEGDLRLVVVDYDELVVSPGKTEHEQQTAVALAAKRMAVALNLVVILISQLRKSTGQAGGLPVIDQLYGAGAKAKHASSILYVQRDFVQTLAGDETEAAIWVLKSRDGQQGKAEARFNVHTLTFEGV